MTSELVETAKRTGGPKTEEGKAASAMNALTHGLRSKTVLPHERDAYEAHHAALIESLEPKGYLEERLSLLLAEKEATALLLPDSKAQKLQRYEAHLERVLYRALHELEAMQEKHKGGQAPLARLEVNT
jgi:hypothetical protein